MLFSVKPPCEQELLVKQTKKKRKEKKTKKQQKHCDRALDLYHILSLICGLYLKCDTSEVIVVGKKSLCQVFKKKLGTDFTACYCSAGSTRDYSEFIFFPFAQSWIKS